jgi:hypothetical protein
MWLCRYEAFQFIHRYEDMARLPIDADVTPSNCPSDGLMREASEVCRFVDLDG